ncbi:thiamine biosynthesis protein ThiS [Kribbella flavida DSM 17836]|uniref:Thiamine biosynthesis protein ThiS n=1 Tax=Kribbella flavida (strain DSM 17836 / JCM 10339 / NBRC 14399) TaxID=479435 RepID=D2Q0C1_KRIFD|nr:sulfur carrier protein ThiS [Kribbella flavida]ADB31913.1 thiamine biosynthesis protein ThiS [Kribbella flavida DSM 17836]
MNVSVNGSTEQLDTGSTVADVVARWARSPVGVAVAVNEAVVTRAEWTATTLAEGDRVEILTAVQGG